jgi:hypothetical protein
VDDVLIVRTSEERIKPIREFLDWRFTIKDLGYAKYLLGLEIARSSSGMYINQKKYILDIIKDASLLSAKPTTTPLLKSYKLQRREEINMKIMRRIEGLLEGC